MELGKTILKPHQESHHLQITIGLPFQGALKYDHYKRAVCSGHTLIHSRGF